MWSFLGKRFHTAIVEKVLTLESLRLNSILLLTTIRLSLFGASEECMGFWSASRCSNDSLRQVITLWSVARKLSSRVSEMCHDFQEDQGMASALFFSCALSMAGMSESRESRANEKCCIRYQTRG